MPEIVRIKRRFKAACPICETELWYNPHEAQHTVNRDYQYISCPLCSCWVRVADGNASKNAEEGWLNSWSLIGESDNGN